MGAPFSTLPGRREAPRAGVTVEVLRSRNRGMRRRRSRPDLDLRIQSHTLRPDDHHCSGCRRAAGVARGTS